MQLSNYPRAAELAASFLRCALGLAFLVLAMQTTAIAQTVTPEAAAAAEATNPGSGVIRLRQPTAPMTQPDERPVVAPAAPTVYVPGEFERFVQRQAGSDAEVRRLGAELITGGYDGRGADTSPLVPQDYLVAPGDEVLVTLWGSVDADLRLAVDRAGRISIPRVGTIQVSGVRYADLQDVISRRISQVFKGYQISVSLGQLRGIRVFVTGFVVKPGTYNLSSLSTVVSALMRAGGPAAAGSFRQVELRRNGQLLTTFDLYDLLLKGDRSADRIIQAGDVVHVNAVGIQVGVIGSVNKPAVVELKAGETVADAVRMAGGFSAVADRTRLLVERLKDRNQARVVQLDMPDGQRQSLGDGDLVRALSAVGLTLPALQQSKRIRVEGEVRRPAEYVLPAGSSIADAIAAAGGLTAGAFPFATEFTRESVRITQQENYDRALRDMETDLARRNSSQRVASTDDASAETARSASAARLLERLRALKPTGRIVLQIPIDSKELPPLALEDGDRIYVPTRPTTVGVFGSVFNAASYLYSPGRTLEEYLRLAGGPTKGADQSSTFVVRANGTVVSDRQSGSWFSSGGTVGGIVAEPGDTVFVPEEMDKTTFVQAAKDWTQILYQFGLGIAGLRSATR